VLTGTDYIEFHFNDLSTLAQLKEDILHKSNVDMSLTDDDITLIKSFAEFCTN
jgi:hypothetical protein